MLQFLWWSLFFHVYSLLKREKTFRPRHKVSFLGPRLYKSSKVAKAQLEAKIASGKNRNFKLSTSTSYAAVQGSFFTVYLSRILNVFFDLEKDNYTTMAEEVVVGFTQSTHLRNKSFDTRKLWARLDKEFSLLASSVATAGDGIPWICLGKIEIGLLVRLNNPQKSKSRILAA